MKLVSSILFAILSVLFIAAPAMAETNTELYDTIEGLKEDNLVLLPTAEVALEPKLQEALSATEIAVVVIPKSSTMDSFDELVKGTEGSDGVEYENFADAVLDYGKDEGYETVIVLSQNKNEVASTGYEETIENLIEGSSATNTQKIILARDDIMEETDSDFSFLGILMFFGIIFGLIFLVGFLVFLGDIFDWFSKRYWDLKYKYNERKKEKHVRLAEKQSLKRIKEEEAQRQKEKEELIKNNPLNKPTPKDVPKALRDQLEELRTWTSNHIAISDEAFAKDIELMLERFQIFYERLNERSDAQNKKVAMVEYADMLTKINSALSDKYYLDIIQNPDLWDEPEERILQVKRAVEGVKYQLLENIKQVNGSRDLDFQASLESLAGFMETPKVKDLYS